MNAGPSGERLRGKGRYIVICRYNCVIIIIIIIIIRQLIRRRNMSIKSLQGRRDDAYLSAFNKNEVLQKEY